MKIKELQDRLMRMGYYLGPKDGKPSKALDDTIAKALKDKRFIPAQLLEDEPIAKPKKGGK